MFEAIQALYEPDDLQPTIEIEGRLTPGQIDFELAQALAQLRPFGPRNNEPEFLIKNLEVQGFEQFGENGRHCKLQPADTDSFTILYWDGAESISQIDHPTTYDIVGTVGIDEFDRQTTVTVSDYQIP